MKKKKKKKKKILNQKIKNQIKKIQKTKIII